MVKMTIEGTDYDTDNMTDEQKSLAASVHRGQTTANELEAELVPLSSSVQSKNHALQCVNAIGRIQTNELKALLSDGKKE